MLLQSHFSSSRPYDRLVQPTKSSTSLLRRRKQPFRASINTIVCLRYGMDAIAEIAHNKVLIAAAVSAAVGQLTKPLSAAILYRESFDIKAVFQAGGFPSTHSSAVVATATSLGLERGFSDAIFGLAIVYASLTMYDAQGVRREVGTHAKTLNKILRSRSHTKSYPSSNGDNLADSSSSSKVESPSPFLLKEPSKFRSKSDRSSLLLRSAKKMNQSTSVLISSSLGGDDEDADDDEVRGLSNGAQYSYILKESVGHTEIEVIAGALLGLCISLAVYSV